MQQFWAGEIVVCCHNEWLNMLVTEGILGLAAYVAVFVTALIGASKRAVEDKRYVPYMCAILAYMGHNLFCYQQCICTPVVFIAIAMIELSRDEYDTHDYVIHLKELREHSFDDLYNYYAGKYQA